MGNEYIGELEIRSLGTSDTVYLRTRARKIYVKVGLGREHILVDQVLFREGHRTRGSYTLVSGIVKGPSEIVLEFPADREFYELHDDAGDVWACDAAGKEFLELHR